MIQDHVISWILIRYHRVNLSESTVNDKIQHQKKNLFFIIFSLFF